jgi:hypothetical protein
MPRRTRPYYPPGTILFNGQTAADDAANPISMDDVMRSTSAKGGTRDLKVEVANALTQFDEFALADMDVLAADLCYQTGQIRSLPLEFLTKGSDSKPHGQALQLLFEGIRIVLEQHGLKPRISQYLDKNHNVKRSAYLRLAVEIARIAGLQPPADPKDVALKAKRRIAHNVI